MSEQPKVSSRPGSFIGIADTIRFVVDLPWEGLKKGSYGTVVGSNGHPVDSYDVVVGHKSFPIVVAAADVELIRTMSPKPSPIVGYILYRTQAEAI